LTGEIKDGTSVADFSTVKRQGAWSHDEIDDLLFSVEDMLSRLNKQTAELSQSREKMQEVVHDTIRAQESERKYISRELHDEAGQLLVTLKSTLDDIIFEFPDDGDATLPSKFDHMSLQKRLEDASNQIEKTLGVVRAISHQMRPSLLDVGDVNLAFKSYCTEFSQRHKIEVIYEGVMIPNLPEDAAVSFYRFLQESLTNVFKHSSATRVRVQAQMDADSVQMSVENDGRKYEAISEAHGIGLAGLKERFALLGGEVDVNIVPGGFIVVARIPLARL
jgi:signal transduction histidine kinase